MTSECTPETAVSQFLFLAKLEAPGGVRLSKEQVDALAQALATTEAALRACQVGNQRLMAELADKIRAGLKVVESNATLTAALQAAEKDNKRMREFVHNDIEADEVRWKRLDETAGRRIKELEAKLNAAPWYSTRPTVEGWYWYQRNGSEGRPFIVEIAYKSTKSGDPDTRLYVWFPDQTDSTYLDALNGEFSGPLTPPGGSDEHTI